MNFNAMLDRVRRAAGMDVDEGQAGDWLNERYKRMVIEADWSKELVDLGDTVADEDDYMLPDSVREIHELRVGSVPYRRIGVQTLWDLQGDVAYSSGSGGFYAPTFNASGESKLTLFPIPTEAGSEISARCTTEPDDLSGADEPMIPVEFHTYIVDGALADAFALVDENLAAADRYEQKYEVGVEKLRRRQNSRVGGGPHFVQIEGVHFRR